MKKFENCILGTAIGDALGMPVEGMTRNQIRLIYGEIKDFLPSPYGDLKAGEWTDDTEQMLVLAESIVETTYFSPENFAEKLKDWFMNTESRRVGPTSRRAVSNLLSGLPWNKAGVNSDTCGAAMRVMPVGLVYHFSFNLVERYAEIQARVTHTGSAAIGGAVAVAVAIACNLLDFSKKELLGEVLKRTASYDTLLADKIQYAYEIREKNLDFAVEKLGNTISALDVVPLAFYCYFSEQTFDDCVVKAVNAGGDADSIAAICGAIKGSEGAEIPEKWLMDLKDVEKLRDVSKKLYELHNKIVSLTQ
jgi:ADP-ribosylglycohydrolase